jgi:hypothetical protein
MGDTQVARWLDELNRRDRRQRLVQNLIGSALAGLVVATAIVAPILAR